MYRNLITLLLILGLFTACQGIYVPTPQHGLEDSPSPSPVIRSPTLPYVPSSTHTLFDNNLSTPTETQTIYPVATQTPSEYLELQIELLSCNTSLDISHGMGEVTNAYILLKNISSQDMEGICAILTASDEERTHPQKTICIDLLPAYHQVALELTVDTTFRKQTSIRVDIAAGNLVLPGSTLPGCTDISFPDWNEIDVGKAVPIP